MAIGFYKEADCVPTAICLGLFSEVILFIAEAKHFRFECNTHFQASPITHADVAHDGAVFRGIIDGDTAITTATTIPIRSRCRFSNRSESPVFALLQTEYRYTIRTHVEAPK